MIILRHELNKIMDEIQSSSFCMRKFLSFFKIYLNKVDSYTFIAHSLLHQACIVINIDR